MWGTSYALCSCSGQQDRWETGAALKVPVSSQGEAAHLHNCRAVCHMLHRSLCRHNFPGGGGRDLQSGCFGPGSLLWLLWCFFHPSSQWPELGRERTRRENAQDQGVLRAKVPCFGAKDVWAAWGETWCGKRVTSSLDSALAGVFALSDLHIHSCVFNFRGFRDCVWVVVVF